MLGVMIIDTHCHLMATQFDEDREDVISRARAHGVGMFLNVGFDDFTNKRSLEMASQHQDFYATLGYHPYEADKCTPELMAKWKKFLLDPKASKEDIELFGVDLDEEQLAEVKSKVLAVGETGLDYLKSPISQEVQKKSLELQLQLATEVDLPIIIHNRQSDKDCLDILRNFSNVKAVYHCFDSNLEYAKKVWNFGYITSFTAIATYPKSNDLREVISNMPLDQFFVETDCPYLAPQKFRGKRNEPAYILEIIKLIAALKGITTEEVKRLSTENVARFFGLVI
jgi:TatD DNase family protein